MNIPMIIIFALAGLITYVLLNVVIRRLIAKVRSREDYDEDVDGIMSAEEKKASEEAKVIEAEKLKIGIKDVYKESNVKFVAITILGFILGGLVGYKFGLSIDTIIFFIFFAVLTVISFVDMATMEIPPELNWIVLGLGIVSTVLTLTGISELTIVQRLVGLVCVSGFMLLLTIIVKGAFGGGDIKLMAAAGLLLGWKGILTSFIFGLFLGAAIGVVLLARREKRGKDHMPFGPSLCLGIGIAVIYGMDIVNWYGDILAAQMTH